MLTMNYCGMADGTARPVQSKARTARSANWAWRPPKQDAKAARKARRVPDYAKDRLSALCGAVQPKERRAKRYAAK